MHHKKDWQQLPQYEPESWRGEMPPGEEGKFIRVERGQSLPSARDQTKVMELLGRVNYKIIKGKRVYVEVDGVVYKTLYGGFWRRVFTGIEHYPLRGEEVSGFVWGAEKCASGVADLTVASLNDGRAPGGYFL